MRSWVLIPLLLMAGKRPQGTDGFDRANPGSVPPGWSCGVTGSGDPKWTVEKDPTAPSAPNVLKQLGKGDFPWCVKNDVSFADGFIEARFKPVSGQEDQAGGLIWRWQGANDYYIARANVLEQNIEIFATRNGRRRSIKSTDIALALNEWHTLRVEFSGQRFTVFFDGKRVIEAGDSQHQNSGSVGVWTKADSVTCFDSFSYGIAPKQAIIP